MKRTPKQRMKTRKDRFVVGYIGTQNVVFCRTPDYIRTQNTTFCRKPKSGFNFTNSGEPMTRLQAERYLKNMPCSDCAIFELVPVAVNR